MRTFVAAAAATSVVAMASPAQAEAVPPGSVTTQEAEALRAEVRELRNRLEALESRLAATAPAPAQLANPAAEPTNPATLAAAPSPATTPATAPTPTAIAWKGSPQFAQGDQTFKVKGRMQADAAYVSAPKALGDKGLGFASEARRIRLGAEGSLSKYFSYKLDVELSDNTVELVDTFVTYRNGPWQVQLGNQNAFWSLDELTGDTSGSVMERAAFTDAFNFERRLGLGVQYTKGPWIAQLGVFGDDVSAIANSNDGVNGGDENNSYSIDGRLVFDPVLGDTQLHLAASGHWRHLGRLEDSATRYRQRPFVHTTNTRLIGTPAMNVSDETMYGVEVAAISGRWHGVSEYYHMSADRVGLATVGFQGAYGEVGYFLTEGDTRGYKGGIFVNNAPAHPLGEDGIGSIQVNVRYDWLDLNDRDIRGGTQNGYIAAVIWSPIQYLRFNLNYALLHYTGATALPSGDTRYDANVIGTRFELDF